MKLIKKILLLACIVSFVSCREYLDVVPDNTLKLENVFTLREDAYNALAKVYNFIPRDENTHRTLWTLGDEYIGRLDYDNSTGSLRAIRIMRGLQEVSNPYIGYWNGTRDGKHLYRGIRTADVFLTLIDGVVDMTDSDKADWKAQVTFLKAYYLFLLVRNYGPIIIPPDNISPESTPEELYAHRLPVDTCFNTIIRLMDQAIPNLKLKASTLELGQVDKIVATAIKARVLLYRASPFFNGNKEYYGDFQYYTKDYDLEPFFTLDYNKEKWKDAIDVINEAITLCESNGIALYNYDKEPYVYDKDDWVNPNLKKLYDLRMIICDPWNKEMIWGYSNIDYYNEGELAHSTNIRLPPNAGYSGNVNEAPYSWQWLGATYRMAERFYTENGLPIDQDNSFDMSTIHNVTITPDPSDVAGYAKYRGIMQPGVETINLYMGREMRFYAHLGVTGSYWRSHLERIPTMFYGNSMGGYNSSQHTTDYFPTGIGIQKFAHPESKSGHWARTVKYPYPIMRLADLYLMKAEALNEYNSAPTADVYDAINKVRTRAGIPTVQAAWSGPNAVTPNYHLTQTGMRDIILRERAIELAFEGSRFRDAWRHKKATSEFSSPIWGWKHAGTTAAAFFQLEIKQQRKFSITDYLWPIPLDEMNTNGNLIQNPGW